jgi:hypothetical protein
MVPVATVRATLLACESPSSGAPAAADPSIGNADCRQRVESEMARLNTCDSTAVRGCGTSVYFSPSPIRAVASAASGGESIGELLIMFRCTPDGSACAECALWTIPFVVSRSCRGCRGCATTASPPQRIPPPLAWSHAHAHARKPLLIADG